MGGVVSEANPAKSVPLDVVVVVLYSLLTLPERRGPPAADSQEVIDDVQTTLIH